MYAGGQRGDSVSFWVFWNKKLFNKYRHTHKILRMFRHILHIGFRVLCTAQSQCFISGNRFSLIGSFKLPLCSFGIIFRRTKIVPTVVLAFKLNSTTFNFYDSFLRIQINRQIFFSIATLDINKFCKFYTYRPLVKMT